MVPFSNAVVKAKFDTYPRVVRERLMVLRELIFDVAREHQEIGVLEETLKWGEPSYIPSRSKSGSMVRIDWKKSTPDQYYMYFLCTTSLVQQIRYLYGDLFVYSGKRALIFKLNDVLSLSELRECVRMALLYNFSKKIRAA